MAKIATKVETDEGLTINFEDGNILEAKLNDLPDAIKLKLMAHGLKQKLGDSYAGAKLEEAFEAASRVWGTLTKGEWSTRVGGGGGAPRVTQLAKALASVAGVDVEVAVEKVSEMGEEERKELRKHPRIKQAIAKMKLEEAEAEAAEAEDLVI